MKPMAVRGELLGIRVVVFDSREAVKLFREGFYGKPFGIRKPKEPEFDAPLELSLLEALYLVEKGLLEVWVPGRGEPLSLDELREKARRAIADLDQQYLVYKELRDGGYVVRSGLKFGSDFAVYEYGPGIDHAPFLVHVMDMHADLDPIEIVRAGRLSHAVRKTFIIAAVDKDRGQARYITFKWYKP